MIQVMTSQDMKKKICDKVFFPFFTKSQIFEILLLEKIKIDYMLVENVKTPQKCHKSSWFEIANN